MNFVSVFVKEPAADAVVASFRYLAKLVKFLTKIVNFASTSRL